MGALEFIRGLWLPAAAVQPEGYEVEWVGQDARNGCAVASLAMVLGLDFDGARERLPIYTPDDGVPGMGYVLQCLAANGWAYQEAWPTYSPAKAARPVWPLRPWAPLHLCAVRITGWHAVVMLADGTVLDPLTQQPRTLGDYDTVYQMVGLWRVQ